jgi:hypothetical protein
MFNLIIVATTFFKHLLFHSGPVHIDTLYLIKFRCFLNHKLFSIYFIIKEFNLKIYFNNLREGIINTLITNL